MDVVNAARLKKAISGEIPPALKRFVESVEAYSEAFGGSEALSPELLALATAIAVGEKKDSAEGFLE